MTKKHPRGVGMPKLESPRAAMCAPDAPWVLYLLECAGERLYAGITNDLAARFAAHCDGRGARFTRAFAPMHIVAACELPSRSVALKAEYALKQLPRKRKLAFLATCGTPLELSSEFATPIRAFTTQVCSRQS